MLAAAVLLAGGCVVGLAAFRHQLSERKDRITRVATQHRMTVRWGDSGSLMPLRSRLPSWIVPEFVDDYFQVVSGIQVISLETDLPARFFDDLRDCVSIRELSWLDTRHSAQVAELVRRQRNLRVLELIPKGLRDEDLNAVESLENLQFLQIDGLESKQFDGRFLIAATRRTPHLKHLKLEHVNLSPAACLAIGRVFSLENLNLTGCRLTAEAAKSLIGLPRLKRLILDDTLLDNAVGTTLGSMKLLESLSVKGTYLTETGLRELAGCTSLKSLVTGGKRGRSTLLASLKKCPRLTHLDVTWAGTWTRQEMAGFNGLPYVTFLYFSDIGDPEAEALTQCPHISGLQIHSSRLTLQGIHSLMQLPELHYLKLTGREWSPELVDVLDESLTLESVNVLGRGWEWNDFEGLREKLRDRGKKPGQ